MPDSGETPQGVWKACAEHSDLVFWVHDQVWWQRDRRLDTYRGWEMDVATADRLNRTLLALWLFALSNDSAVDAGRYLTGQELAWIPLVDIVDLHARRRPYELFAGLDAIRMDPAETRTAALLKLLAYDDLGRGPLILMRLGAGFHLVVKRLTERYRNPGLNLRDLRVVAWDHPRD